MKLKQLSLVAGVLLLTACSSSIDPASGERKDPLEGFNRAMWKVNYDYIDTYALKPVAKGWRDYVPSPIKTGLTNVANNLDEPASFVNRLLEGEGKKAMIHFNRFWINSIFGLGGLIDWASQTKDLKLDNGNREFGHTLGSYSVPTGAYIMVPGYGATTPRQAVGKAADSAYPVLSMLTMPWTVAKFAIQGVDSRAKLLDQDPLLQQSADPYVTFREAYFQNLEFKVSDGKAAEESGQEQLSEEELKDID
ncbi:MlaA family lipoprotein [Actinobacillus pleuropneumoniae]|uniref:MlaA family lipoprotein n=1 Tax=Actinobacillus pleuropneumoniae TaxID=715 RepID=UPI0001E49947|nr:VacJ family lipoprotein [Actinobacillus pleuropneumoniae]EFM95319.1 Lipoprotein VacJ-like protein [Actinobacillus pleuropneumoniae serovar 10 str. D13039]EFM99627.1 Lipoprotein VacJ-like protein [Actinobacillus pleuropneumoniae serovar 12 str. 1096]UKH29644.1 VacJ family lipoprotein [Actinobacillus pleuropneumoniae]UKH33779.1 VacJ family lipoprotein [Actinobacillus pleuropneumoniae serovar 10 str. D13039]